MRNSAAATFLCFWLTGCGGPSVVYYLDDPTIQKAPPVGSISFALRTSNITLMRAGGSTSGDSRPGGSGEDHPVGGGTHVPSAPHNGSSGTLQDASPSPDQATQNALKTSDVCAGAKVTQPAEWMKCFGVDVSKPQGSEPTVSVVVTPEADTGTDPDPALIYTAVPDDDWLQLQTTEFSETVSGSIGLLPTDVSVKFNNRSKEIVTSIGGGISAGAPFGPFGMVVGGLAAFVSKTTFAADVRPYSPRFVNFICKPELASITGILEAPLVDKDNPLSLVLPVVIPLNDTLRADGHDNNGGPDGVATPDHEQCWNLLPKGPGRFSIVSTRAKESGYKGSGWLYRIRLDKPARNSQPWDSYFDVGSGLVTSSKSDFPFSSCRKAHLDILWWAELNGYLMAPDPQNAGYSYLSIPIEVADPTNVGAAALPTAGDIKFGNVCGATTSPTADNNPRFGDTVSAILGQIKAIRDAQKGGSNASSGVRGTSSHP